MFPPPTFLPSDRERDTTIETPSAMQASRTSEAAASDAMIAMRGMALDEDESAEIVRVAFVSGFCVPVAAFADVDGFACLRAWCFLAAWWCLCLTWCLTVCVVVDGGEAVVVVVVVVVDDVTGGGSLVVGGGAGVELVGGGGGGGGVSATAAVARPRPAASATTHPTTTHMTREALICPLCGGLPHCTAHRAVSRRA
jgi:hypothetical protein